MRGVALLLLILTMLTACEQEPVQKCDGAVLATVRDLTGLDGCGYVFELQDGTRLQPYLLLRCGTPPLPKEVTENPLFNFEWVEGKRVLITYEVITDMASSCMAGSLVKVTCLQQETINPEQL
ncbi:MAG: hypothetical protein KF775_05990 [Cyclobacteriaceae bacterium]|nr:hypothetical protein [Cytophagales bacterium]MBX2899177.1 hypothetical protein [Cyclobacteriaceae bacterium]